MRSGAGPICQSRAGKTGCRQRGFRIATAMTLTTQKGSVPDFDCFGNEEIVLISRFFINKYNYISFTDFPQSSLRAKP
ncbi:hypothetical protein [Oceanibaculum nanhaiense]|jgi:hypothetical protein|uniref:hypothetical protein n=1 Tax=Oceanibaculum nanhaiense TaxID=1909734 RepID=UPI00111F2FEF|nr:hypothetical protein [Oceanibaculum nanhaiense]